MYSRLRHLQRDGEKAITFLNIVILWTIRVNIIANNKIISQKLHLNIPERNSLLYIVTCLRNDWEDILRTKNIVDTFRAIIFKFLPIVLVYVRKNPCLRFLDILHKFVLKNWMNNFSWKFDIWKVIIQTKFCIIFIQKYSSFKGLQAIPRWIFYSRCFAVNNIPWDWDYMK